MSRNVYALLVGIDNYPDPVPTLHGCRNDIEAMASLLKARVSADGDTLHLRSLFDAQATRDAVIGAFRDHLGRAGEADVALFYYSGHGSQENAPEVWWDIEPDHLDETLVLYDSRLPGQWDLADKEIAALLGEVAQNKPHLLVVLDCCHSGSGTRAALEDGIAERKAPTDRRDRPLSSFLFDAAQASQLTKPIEERAVLGDSGWALPQAHHILLSGCRSNETSKEVVHQGQPRGAMSLALEMALSSSGGDLTYRDIHRQVSANLRSTVLNQNPQIETSAGEDLDRPFLGGAIAKAPTHFVVSRVRGKWVIDGGVMHGIAAPVGDEVTLLEIQTAGGQAVAQAKVIAATVGESTIEIVSGHTLSDGTAYRAIVTGLPLPPMLVRLVGDTERIEALRTALAQRDEVGPLLIAEAGPHDPPAITVVCGGTSGYLLSRTGSERALCSRADGPDQAVAALEHVAKWWRVATLHNGVTQLSSNAVGVAVSVEEDGANGEPIEANGEPIEVDGQYRISYRLDDAGARPRSYCVVLTNNSGRDLWVALLDLTDTYGIYCDEPVGLFQLGSDEVKTIELIAEVPDELFDKGITETGDLLKLIVSTEEFDPRSLAQDGLDVTAPPDAAAGVRGTLDEPKSTLDRLMRQVGTRRARPSSSVVTADWFTWDIRVTSVRPSPGVRATPDHATTLATGVRLAPHPTLKATLRLTNAPDATRDLLTAPVPDALRGAQSAPFGLVVTRGGEPEADSIIVNLDKDADHSVVTDKAPLVIQLDQTLDTDEHVLPFAWDGEFYIPLGFSRSTDAGLEVVVERLANPVATARSLTGSIRMLFRKVAGQRLGLPAKFPLLRTATVDADGTVTYEADKSAVTSAVKNAESVLLYVHGIIGDTEGMARSSRMCGGAKPIGPEYDVILTFDYENIGTAIAENATTLKDHLDAVGLGSGHHKRFDIVAHSMGGLVCRHMIEFVGGVQVSRLVTLGTPNGGSPWPTVQKWGTAAVAFAANSLTAVAWPAKAIAWVMGAMERIDTGLDDMQADSEFLANLASGPDPNLPYHVIIGDRSLIVHADADAGRIERLLSRLSPGAAVSDVIDLAFFNRPNDLAVSVASAQQMPAGRAPAPQFYVLPSDHVHFFATPASLGQLADVLLG